MTFVASFHDAFDRVSAFFALSSSGTCDAARALVELWCCLASVAAVSAYRPTRSLPPARCLPATGRQRAGALVTLCEGGDAQEWPPPSVWLQQAGAMWVTAALLGPVCRLRRQAFGARCASLVLHYASESIAGPPLLLKMGGQVVLETCWWVPVAFGGAGLVLGAAPVTVTFLIRKTQTKL